MMLEIMILFILVFISPKFVPNKHWLRFYLSYFMYIFYGTFGPFILLPFRLFGIQIYSRAVMSLFHNGGSIVGVKWQNRNEEAFKKNKRGIIVVNHQSILDPLGILMMNDGLVSLVGVCKKELYYIPPLFFYLWTLGFIFIDRKKRKEAMEMMSESMKKKDKKLFIFPEGTRNKNGNGLLPFKKGAFSLAIEHKVPIIPLVISPYYFIKQGKEFSHGKVIVSCLEPIETKDLREDDIDELLITTRKLMETEYLNLRSELGVESDTQNNCKK